MLRRVLQRVVQCIAVCAAVRAAVCVAVDNTLFKEESARVRRPQIYKYTYVCGKESTRVKKYHIHSACTIYTVYVQYTHPTSPALRM